MNKKLMIGAGILVVGYLAYKHFKKPAVVVVTPVAPVVKAVENPASGKPMIVVTK